MGRKAVLLNSICSLDVDRCNQENIICASLGIHILRDIFEVMQKEYKQVRLNKLICRQETWRQGSVVLYKVVATAKKDIVQEGCIMGLTVYPL